MDKHIFIVDDIGEHQQLVDGLTNMGYSTEDMVIYSKESDVIDFPENGPMFFMLTADCLINIIDPKKGFITIIQTEKVLASTIQEMIEKRLPETREVIDVMKGKRRASYSSEHKGDVHSYLFYTGCNVTSLQTAFHNTINGLV